MDAYDYTSNASIQVMLFKGRLEIWNLGQLALGLNTAKLSQPYTSIPANPLLAEPIYLAGYIERLGTGAGDIIRLCDYIGQTEPPVSDQTEPPLSDQMEPCLSDETEPPF